MRVVFWVVCVGQDKGLGPKWPKLLSAHRFFGTQPKWGGTGNMRKPQCYRGLRVGQVIAGHSTTLEIPI